MRTIIIGVTCCLSVLLTAGSASTADDGFVALFNGKDLSGWTVEGDARFSVRDGELRLDGGMGWLRTDARYGDFELHMEWKAEMAGYDSGIFIRTPNDGKTPWPQQRSQVNMRSDQVGFVVGSRRAKAASVVHPPGQWNTFDIVCQGKRIVVKVNGETVNRLSFLQRKSGHIGIQAETHRFAFRNVRIKELDTRPLFNGKDLSGWREFEHGFSAWKVEEGVLHCTGEPRGGWLRTVETFRDFDLKVDFKYARDANSGICLRAASTGGPSSSGMELQIIDADGPRYKGKLKDWQLTGALYAKRGPRGNHVKPAGQWNHIEANCRGDRLVVWLNGYKIQDVDLSVDPEEKNNLARRAKTGFIGLQNYGDKVWFRNIRVRADGT